MTAEKKAEIDGFEIDLFSTFLSRKNSYHRLVGKMRYTKVKKVKK